MSRHRSRRVPRGSMPLPEQPPIYAQNPLGFPLWLPRGWVMKPIWRTRGARQWLVFCLVAPFAILAIAILAVLIHSSSRSSSKRALEMARRASSTLTPRHLRDAPQPGPG